MKDQNLPTCSLDHLVITAPDLVIGAAFIKDTLGVDLQTGGAHPKMGTHNLLLSLGENTYLEVIAPDRAAPNPGRPRWFELDEFNASSSPRLAAWVVRTQDIYSTVAGMPKIIGEIESMTRGDLEWLITIPPNGRLNLNGALPAFIEWHTQIHPAKRLQPSGCSLLRLEIFHPQAETISSLLHSVGFLGLVSFESIRADQSPTLIAHIQTPFGLKKISG